MVETRRRRREGKRLAKLKAGTQLHCRRARRRRRRRAEGGGAEEAGGVLRCVQCVAPAPAEAPRLSMPEGVYKTPEQVLRATSVALLAA